MDLNRGHNQAASAQRQLGRPVGIKIDFNAERHISHNVEGVARRRRFGGTRAYIDALKCIGMGRGDGID